MMTPFGYATGGYYTKIALNGKDNEYNQEYHLMHALAPEIGVAVRMWRVVLSYRYQYRYMLNIDKPVSDDLGKSRNLLGVGFCW